MRIALAVLAIMFMSSVIAHAEEDGWTKEKFVKTLKQWAEKEPHWNPTTEELEEQFDQRDVDGDGLVSEMERKAKLKKQYVKQQMKWASKDPSWNPTEEDLEAKFDSLDTNHDGLLTDEEQEKGKKK